MTNSKSFFLYTSTLLSALCIGCTEQQPSSPETAPETTPSAVTSTTDNNANASQPEEKEPTESNAVAPAKTTPLADADDIEDADDADTDLPVPPAELEQLLKLHLKAFHDNDLAALTQCYNQKHNKTKLHIESLPLLLKQASLHTTLMDLVKQKFPENINSFKQNCVLPDLFKEAAACITNVEKGYAGWFTYDHSGNKWFLKQDSDNSKEWKLTLPGEFTAADTAPMIMVCMAHQIHIKAMQDMIYAAKTADNYETFSEQVTAIEYAMGEHMISLMLGDLEPPASDNTDSATPPPTQ